ncbi:MAG: MltA domain-containing protein [Cytophagales bacterium]|nr:MltA domain-containing protein [Cytophagales bacterium]
MLFPLFRCVVFCSVAIVSHSYAQDALIEPPAAMHPNSRWTAVSWDTLPSVFDDNPREALGAWLASCARPQALWRKACGELSALKSADSEVIRMWMMSRLQPYRIESPASNGASASVGLLTGYYEPVLVARREADDVFRYPLYRLPAELERAGVTRPWFTRQAIDTVGSPAQQALQGRAIAYLQSPLDVLALQIQGSGQLDLVQAHGVHQRIRLAFAGSNNQPYKSVGVWLRDTYGLRDLSWPAIKAWALSQPDQMNNLVWSNPRVVFFKERPASNEGPLGAQGLPLTAGRSIAVDAKSIPYGTPVWLASEGESLSLKRLVIAQDTGTAIVGAVRADYYVGSGDAAGEIAGRLKQGLQMWVLWPK